MTSPPFTLLAGAGQPCATWPESTRTDNLSHPLQASQPSQPVVEPVVDSQRPDLDSQQLDLAGLSMGSLPPLPDEAEGEAAGPASGEACVPEDEQEAMLPTQVH